MLITRPTNDGRTHRGEYFCHSTPSKSSPSSTHSCSGILRRLLAELHKKGIITEDLSLPKDFEDLELVFVRRRPPDLVVQLSVGERHLGAQTLVGKRRPTEGLRRGPE